MIGDRTLSQKARPARPRPWPRPWRRPWPDLLAAVQFLSRVPVLAPPFTAETMPRALAWFPVVGAALGGAAGLLERMMLPHLSPLICAGFAVLLLVALTGAMHEDALADCADAFGLKRSRARTLEIMRDSAIGSFGGVALVFSIGLRVALLAALPAHAVLPQLVAATALGRWSTLPLTLLPSARPDSGLDSGMGATISQQTSKTTLLLGTLLMLLIVVGCLRSRAAPAIVAASLVTIAGGIFCRHRIGGMTGDCFGATTQLVEIAVLTCGAWMP